MYKSRFIRRDDDSMVGEIFQWIVGKLHDGSGEERDKKTYFSQNASFGARDGMEARVDFYAKGKKVTIVDESGRFVNFPGIANEACVASYCNMKSIAPVIEFRSEFFTTEENKHIVIWQIQPDGRYWEDESGFGSESDCEVRLYSFLDDNGKFTSPFRIYNIGVDEFIGTNKEEIMVREYLEKK